MDHLHHLFVFFLQASGQQIPVVVQSCVCFINLNGTHVTPRTRWSCRYTFKELLSRIEIASVYQVFTMKGYFECQVLKWRSITFEMHLKEVDKFVCESRPATPMFTTGLHVCPGRRGSPVWARVWHGFCCGSVEALLQNSGETSLSQREHQPALGACP